MAKISFISGLLTQTDSALRSFVFDGYHALANSLTPVIGTCVSLMVVGYGWALMRGMIKTPIIEATNAALKLGVVLTLAKNWSFFSDHIYEFFTNGPIALTKVMITTANIDWSLLGANRVDKALENGFNQGMDSALLIIKQTSFGNWAPLISGMLAVLAVVLTCGYAVGLLVMAKVGLAVCLAFAPLFLLCYLFESTKKISESWMQHIIGFALTPLAVHSVLMLVLSLMNYSLGLADPGKEITFATAGIFLLWAIVSIPLLVQTKSLMSSIASGFSFSTMGAFGRSMDYAKATPGRIKQGVRAGGSIINKVRSFG